MNTPSTLLLSLYTGRRFGDHTLSEILDLYDKIDRPTIEKRFPRIKYFVTMPDELFLNAFNFYYGETVDLEGVPASYVSWDEVHEVYTGLLLYIQNNFHNSDMLIELQEALKWVLWRE